MKVVFPFFNHPPTPFNTSVAALCAVVARAGHERVALSIPLETPADEAAARVEAVGADVIAVSAMTRDWPFARALLEALPGAAGSTPFRVVGGYHASMAPRQVALSGAVDAICVGDGERAMQAVLAGPPQSSVPGLWVRGRSGFEGDPPPPNPEPDIASLPPWDYEVFGGVDAILDHGVNTFGPLVDRYLPTRASRGCPFRCAYCSAPVWSSVAGFGARGSRNVRPVEHLCAELAGLREQGSPAGFEFWDEHFPMQIEWLERLADIYPDRVGLPFKVEMHPSAASRERLALLAKAGCKLFHCGVEAGDASLRRDTLNRRTSDEVLERVFRDARELGLETSASVMTALPGETYEQARRTVALLRRLEPDSFMWSTFMTLPRTVLGERLAAHVGPVSAMSDGERDAIHRELSELQDTFVRGAEGGGAARKRPVARPGITAESRARPESTAEPCAPELQEPQPAGTQLREAQLRETQLREAQSGLAFDVAAALDLDPPDAPLSPTFRVREARWSAPELLIEIEALDVAPHTISIAPVDGLSAYAKNDDLRFSHRGPSAPPAVLAELQRLRERLDAASFAALRPSPG